MSMYEGGQEDARVDAGIPPGGTEVFRPRYRKLSRQELSLHDEIKANAARLYDLIQEVHNGAPSREKSLAQTKLEESIMWAIKALTK